MRLLLVLSVIVIFACSTAWASEPDELDSLEKFITKYHREPAPKRVPEMLRNVLNGQLVQGFSAKGPPQQLLLLCHAFGHMARGNAELVRTYESRFVAVTQPGKLFLLTCLQICGDQETVKQIKAWQRDAKNSDLKKALETARHAVSNPKRSLPRDRPPRFPTELDLLWVDFLVTGEYPPVARILDVLDRQDRLRVKIETWLKNNGDKRCELLKPLRKLGLLQPKTLDKLIQEDLALTLVVDKKGKIRDYGGSMRQLQPILQLSEDEWTEALLLKAVASWSMQSNMEQHPRLCELLKKHCNKRSMNSKRLVQLWLAQSSELQK